MKKYLLCLSLLALFCCARASHPQATQADVPAPTNLILITIDTWRYDAAGFLGHPVLKTPQLDQLAAEGLVFDRSYAHAVVTQPSHASILTGLLPYEHGIRDNSGFRLAPNTPTLASLLKQKGFKTGAFVSAFPLDARYGLNQGFDVYDDFVEGYKVEGAHVPERPGKATLEAAQSWYQSQTGHSRFLWVHLYGPHFPYRPDAPFEQQYPQNPYLGEVAQVDSELSSLFNMARSEGNTIIVVTADHGEGLGDHGELTHGLFAYEATLRVPLVIWGPNWIQPGHQPKAVGHMDLLPTLSTLFHFKPPQVNGRNLLAPFSDTPLYFEALSAYYNRGWAPLRCCVAQGKKSIHLPIPERYDLEND
ncbi:MAG: sulfatase, partial [Acidobacteria bacterium]|nr:sulfatase [Acidobacteriota bacterium]